MLRPISIDVAKERLDPGVYSSLTEDTSEVVILGNQAYEIAQLGWKDMKLLKDVASSIIKEITEEMTKGNLDMSPMDVIYDKITSSGVAKEILSTFIGGSDIFDEANISQITYAIDRFIYVNLIALPEQTKANLVQYIGFFVSILTPYQESESYGPEEVQGSDPQNVEEQKTEVPYQTN